jgi:hypothetical protein
VTKLLRRAVIRNVQDTLFSKSGPLEGQYIQTGNNKRLTGSRHTFINNVLIINVVSCPPGALIWKIKYLVRFVLLHVGAALSHIIYCLRILYSVWVYSTGADPGFQVSTEKNSAERREARTFLGYFLWKITILRQKIIFFPILGPAM